MLCNVIIIILSLLLLLSIIILIIFKRKNDKRIKNLISLIERINEGDYGIDWGSMREGNYGILQNELYKTTVFLREKSEREREDKLRVKKALSDISHQIKTPLTTIKLNLEELSETYIKDLEKENFLLYIRRMKRASDHISELVSEVLKLSKLEANAVNFNKEKCTADEIIRASILRVESLSDLKNVNIIYNKGSEKALFLDKAWQSEAISNILKNCIEHSKENDNVIISVSDNPLYLKIEISDSGGGVKEADLVHIFERFYGENKGTGIGLSLSKEIINKENGTVFARNYDKGMLFLIQYPLHDG